MRRGGYDITKRHSWEGGYRVWIHVRSQRVQDAKKGGDDMKKGGGGGDAKKGGDMKKGP